MKYLTLAALILLSLFQCGCYTNNKGDAEKTGERADEIIDNVKEGKNPLHRKGTLEKMGEAVDEEVGKKR